MVLSDQACVMLLVRPFFATFTTKDVADAAATTEAISPSRRRAARRSTRSSTGRSRSAARPAKEPQDEGFMYGRSFHDLDGHAWEVMWMDPARRH